MSESSVEIVLETDDLLDEVLVHIFSFLPVDDIKSCRLVCQRWRSCCEHPTITEMEKFVFRRVYSAKEINNFLHTLSRPRVNVEFVNIKIYKIELRKFGSKITKLQITNCNIDDEKTFKNLLVLTPNLKHLDIRLDKTFDFSLDSETPKKAIAALERDSFQNRNLEVFEYHTSSSSRFFPISLLEVIFPRIRSIRLMDINLLQPFIEKSIKELYNCRIDFDTVARTENFSSVPKLKLLHLKANLSLRRRSSIELCLEFFMRQTELEVLLVKFIDNNIPENVDERVADGPKMIFFQILRSCKKLTNLTFGLQDRDLFSFSGFNENDAVELNSLMKLTRIKLIGLTEVYLRNLHNSSSETETEGSENANTSIVEDIHKHLFGKPRHVLDMKISIESCAEIAAILSSRTRLRRLDFYVKWTNFHESLSSDQTIPSLGARKHKELNHLKIRTEGIPSDALIALIHHLSEWDLPNLLSINFRDLNDEIPEYLEFKILLMKWLERMTNLEEVRVHFYGLEIVDCIQMCKRLTKLQQLEWSNTEKPDPKVITLLFEECPRLRHIILYIYSSQDSLRYYYCRSEKRLYRCKVATWEGSSRYKSIRTKESTNEVSNDVARSHLSGLVQNAFRRWLNT